MNGFLSFLLLLIAASLLAIAAAAVRAHSGRRESAAEGEAKVLLLGLSIGFISYFLMASMLFLFPIAVAAVLAASWILKGDVAQPGAFLIAFGGLWTVLLGWQRWNDLSDPAVTLPGWTAYPLAAGVAMLVAGLWLRFASRR